MKRKILIVGGSHSDIPLIKSAKQQGFFVYTAGNIRDDAGHQFSDEFINIDYCDKGKILDFVRDNKIQYICPASNDFSYITTCYVADKLNLPGNYDSMENVLTIHHKDQFRKFCQNNSIDCPRAKSFDNIELALNDVKKWQFPLISKPIDFCGGRGIVKIKDQNDVLDAVTYSFNSSRQGKFVVEEFISGSNHGFSAILKDQKIIFGFFDNELYYKNEFRVSGAYYPSIVPQESRDIVMRNCEKIAKILNLKDGIFHVQFILKPNSVISIIEITRRPPGDLYIDLVTKVTGVNYPDILLKLYTGQNVKNSDLIHSQENNFILRHCIMSEKNGIIKDVKYHDSIKNKIIDQLIIGKIGDEIADYMTYKYGIAFIKFDSLRDMQDNIGNIQELIKITIS